MKLVIGADSAGFALKEAVIGYLAEAKIEYEDLTPKNDVVYYETAQTAAKGLQNGKYDRGILCCGTGMGMSIVANKFSGVYASCVESVYAAQKCRIINNANMLCMGGFIIGAQMGLDIVKAFLKTSFCEGTDEELKSFLVCAYGSIGAAEAELFKA